MNLHPLAFLAAAFVVFASATAWSADNTPPSGFTALFNGKDFTGWHGVGTEDPRKVAAMDPDERARKFAASLDDLNEHWKIDDGELVNDGKGLYMTTDKDFGDYELHVEAS